MAFPADDVFLGPASFGRLKSYSGIIWHTTEGGGWSRTAALGTARYQLTNPGSYNFIIYDGGLLLTVPYLEASGGINPFSASWAPERFAFLKEGLSPEAYADPTMHHLQVAFSGKTASIDAGLMPPNMLAAALRLRDWWEAEIAERQVLQSGHKHWQSNRSDPGKVYEQLKHATLPDTSLPQGDPMLKYKAEGWKVKAGGATVRETPGGTAFMTFAAGVALTSTGETLDGLHRLLVVTKGDVDYQGYISRAELDPLVPGGDPAFNDSVKALLLSRKAPTAPVEDCNEEVKAATDPLNAKIAAAKAALA